MLGLGDPGVGNKVAGVELDLHLVLGFAHLHPAADPGHRHRITIAVQGDVTFDIHQAFLQPVDLGNPDRQRSQMPLLDGEQLAGHGAEMFLVSGVDAVAPLAGLLIQVLPTGEGASGQEVILDEMEGPFHPARTVGVPELMSHETEAETLGKSRPSRAREPSPVRCRVAPPHGCCRS